MTHIVIVDDDQHVLQSVQRVLQDAGFEVTAVPDPYRGLSVIRQQRPDLVVLDMIMPQMNGTEICQHLRADPFFKDLPIIFLTAKGRPQDVAEGLNVGADDYLIKPFEVIELPARIRALLPDEA